MVVFHKQEISHSVVQKAEKIEECIVNQNRLERIITGRTAKRGENLENTKWVEWAKVLQAIAQAGLTYSTDVFDRERFEMIRDMSVEMMAYQTHEKQSVIRDLFANEVGYATPKVDVRAVIFKNDCILLVKEKADGKWSLPGCWGDVGLTPSEVAVQEVREEAGFDVKAHKLLAVFDKKCHPHPPSPYHVYKFF